jgi:hypothetical protein
VAACPPTRTARYTLLALAAWQLVTAECYSEQRGLSLDFGLVCSVIRRCPLEALYPYLAARGAARRPGSGRGGIEYTSSR